MFVCKYKLNYAEMYPSALYDSNDGNGLVQIASFARYKQAI